MKSKLLLFSLMAFCSGLIAQNIDDGLIGYFPLAVGDLQNNSTIKDHSAYDIPIYAPAVSFFDDDYLGNPGEAAAVAYPNPAAYMSLNEKKDNLIYGVLQDFSISFRITSNRASLPNLPNFTPIMTIMGSDGDSYRLEFNNLTDKVRFSNYTSTDEEWFALNSSSEVERDWVNDYDHISVTYNAQFELTRLYINGKLEDSSTMPAQIPYNPTIFFGKDHNELIAQYPMCFDGLHIHNRALTIQEVETLSQGFTTSLEDDLLQQGIKVFMYPNPVTDQSLTVMLNSIDGPVQVKVTNVAGQLMSEQVFDQADNFSLQMPPAKGLYFVNLRTNKRQYTRKIMVK